MTKTNGPQPTVKFNPEEYLQDDDLPVFNDTCRDRGSSPTPRVIEGEVLPEQEQQQAADIQPVESQQADPPTTPKDPLEADPPETSTPAEVTPPQKPQPRPVGTPSELSSTLAGPVRTIMYSLIHDRRTLLDQLVKTIPLNPYGLPEFIYRPDLLDPARFDHFPTNEEARALQEVLGSAIINLTYQEGFPALPSGLPFWANLEWEDHDGYKTFTEYLEQPGVRSLHALQGLPLDQGLDWFTLNYWSWRAKSFDLYQAAHEQRMRIRRILHTEGAHYELAEKLLKQVRGRVNSFTEDELDQIDPMSAVNMMEKLVRVQRISLGLAAAGAMDEGKGAAARQPLPIEQQMRKLTKDSQFEEQRRQDDTEIDILRDSPEALEMAQELILKLGQSKNPPPLDSKAPKYEGE
jgi:hypothetical protein